MYLEDLAHASVTITHVKSIDISKQIVNHLQQNCITHKVDNDKLRRHEDKVLFLYPIGETENKHRISITSSDLKTLNPKTWLNDKIIKLYLTMLEHQYKNEDIQIMDSYFYTTLVNNGCKALSSWFRIPALLRKKVIIIPINQFEYHWSLMLIVRPDMLKNVLVSNATLPCNSQRTVLVGLDSASTGISFTASKDIHCWLNYITKRSKNTQINSHNLPLIQPDVPYQNNNYDCGVYCLEYARLLYMNNQWYKLTCDKIALGETITMMFKFDGVRIDTLRKEFRQQIGSYGPD